MKEFIHSVVDLFRDLVREGERQVTTSFYNVKRKMFRFAMELLLFAIAIVFILVGGVLILNKLFALEWILLITGLILINFILMTAKFK